jgi:hypothetical protein
MERMDIAIAVCSALFVAVLAFSAYWDPTIRALHAAEAIPYIAAAVLSLRRRTAGYALGFAAGGLWLLMAGTRTSFVVNGFQRLFRADFSRPDLLIAVPAAIATGGLALFSVLAYARQPAKSARDALLFVAALVFVPLFFLAIFAAFQPRYLGIFGIH